MDADNPFADPSVANFNAEQTAYQPPTATPASYEAPTVNYAAYQQQQAQIQQQQQQQQIQQQVQQQVQQQEAAPLRGSVIEETESPWLAATIDEGANELLSMTASDPMPDGPLMQAMDMGEMDYDAEATTTVSSGDGEGVAQGESSFRWFPRWPGDGLGARPPPLTEEERQTLNKMVVRMRIANVTAASLMVTSALLTILADSSATMSTFVVALYVSCFGCLLCCFETHLAVVARTIAENFGFMYSAKGRFLFLVLLSTLCFSMDGILPIITGSILCATALLNLYVLCRYPQYEEECRAADGKGGGNQSIATLAGGAIAGYARANPDVVADAATGAAKFAVENPEATASLAGAFHGNNKDNQPPPPPPTGGGTMV